MNEKGNVHMLEIRIHGYGGQGTVTIAHLLAQAALDDGKQSQALPSFGVERRGAPVKASVRISTSPIMVFSQIVTPDVLVCMDEKLVDIGLAEGSNEDCIILVNSAEENGTELKEINVDAAIIANEEGLVAGDQPMLNIPMLGALAAIADISLDVLEQVLRNKWSGDAAERNVNAARRGFESVAIQKEVIS